MKGECLKKIVTYRTFKRSAKSFPEFANAKKIVIDRHLTFDEALRACNNFRQTRTAAQIRRGTKLEFEKEE